MKFTEVKDLTNQQKREVLNLWNTEYPVKLFLPNISEFDEYLEPLTEKSHTLLIDEDGTIKGWLILFVRDNEQCFALILDSSLQGKGWGSKFLDWAKGRKQELIGWVVDNDDELKRNGEYYKSPILFYKKNNFEIHPEIQLIKKEVKGIKVIWRSSYRMVKQ